MEDGSLITLPVHKIRIANIAMNGEPVLEFDTRSIKNLVQSGQIAVKDFVDDADIDIRLKGFPKEIIENVSKGSSSDWIQLNPKNTFVLQDTKEDWLQYAIPMVASCLSSFSKKALISNYENAMLSAGSKTFLQVNYGDKEGQIEVDGEMLSQVKAIYKSALRGGSIAVMDQFADAKFIQADTKTLFDNDKSSEVNAEILSAGGIASVVVSGRSDQGSSFASAQVSLQTAAMRIRQAQDNVAEMMNRINARLNGNGTLPRKSSKRVPAFRFNPTDLANDGKFQEACYKLWMDGVVSTKTLTDAYRFDFTQELERRKKEATDGTAETLVPRNQKGDTPRSNDGAGASDEGGRPEIDDGERTSDKSKALSGKQPKPSNPDGSM